MSKNNEPSRIRMCIQTSVGGATTGGHGDADSSASRHIASGNNKTTRLVDHPGQTSGVATGSKGVSRRRSVLLSTDEEEELLKSPAKNDGKPSSSAFKPSDKITHLQQKEDTGKPRSSGSSSAGRKNKRQYAAALKAAELLRKKQNLTVEERVKLEWAEGQIAESRRYFEQKVLAGKTNLGSKDPSFHNIVEESLQKKQNDKRKKRSVDEDEERVTPEAKKSRKPYGEAMKQAHTGPWTKRRTMKEVAANHLIVALIDKGDKEGKMSLEHWKLVEMKMLNALVEFMEENADKPVPSFDGAGWFMGVKIIKCNDQQSLEWCTEMVKTFKDLWSDADLEVVERTAIPSIPKAKVFVPRIMDQNSALKLLQRQNPTIPTGDWKVLKVDKPVSENGGQMYVIQINKEAEDILYPKFGKMAWGIGSVFLRLKKRHPKDGNDNTLESGEVEKDLGLEVLSGEVLHMTLDLTDSPNEEDSDGGPLSSTVVAKSEKPEEEEIMVLDTTAEEEGAEGIACDVEATSN